MGGVAREMASLSAKILESEDDEDNLVPTLPAPPAWGQWERMKAEARRPKFRGWILLLNAVPAEQRRRSVEACAERCAVDFVQRIRISLL